jgi:hypothetical protein
VLTPSTSVTLPQVFCRRLTYSGVIDSGISAVQGIFGAGSIPGSSTGITAGQGLKALACCVLSTLSPTSWSVLYRLDGKQSSISFEDFELADAFKKLADKFGPDKRPTAHQPTATNLVSGYS